jgi:hypothetical protein
LIGHDSGAAQRTAGAEIGARMQRIPPSRTIYVIRKTSGERGG